ncbi:MFS transporter [Rubrobacter marinus]|uniref:MFS transporter n=1 Tax=Rubrobacter marinus TaxID=2653852 RepID=A0A6G8PVA6_9ACTN|nr:MFS transporter [Rubrobacter marinus]QIN78113.1 MFS transporter [Rubrobacter marinus]
MRSSQARFALRSRSFAIFAAGTLVSQTGEWMTLVALNWAVLEFTGSAVYLGLINACRLVPVFLLSVPAGVLADRTDRRKLLILMQAGTMLSTFWVGYLLAAGSPFWLLAAVVTLRSVMMAVVTPVRNSLIPNLVPERQVASAVAVDGAVRNVARIAGPAIAGVLLAVMEVSGVFWISACSIAAVLLSLSVVRPESKRDVGTTTVGADIREAAAYVKNSPSVQSLLILAVVPMVFAFPYTAMMPLFAEKLLRLGPEGLGILLSVAAAGALMGSAWLSLGGETEGAGRWLVCSTIGLGLFLLLFMISQSFVVAAVTIFLVGLASSTYRTMSRVTLQTRVPDRLRGRIMSIALMDRGLMPLGAILIGAVAEWAGALWAGAAMGAGCIAVTLAVLAARPRIWSL